MQRIVIAAFIGAVVAGLLWSAIPENPFLGLALCAMLTAAALAPLPERLLDWRDAIRTGAVVTVLLTLFPTAKAFVEQAL